MEIINVLITGAGSTMGQSVMKALMQSKYRDRLAVFLTNSDNTGAGFYMGGFVRGNFLVPLAKAENYINAIMEICRKEKIHAVFSGTEHEITALSNASADIYKETGAVVLLSRPEVVMIGTDKLKTYEFFKDNSIIFPETALLSDYKELVEKCGYPLFMKPRTASASRNIFKINKEEDLWEYQFAQADQIILQEYLDSELEYTVGVVCDKQGRYVSAIPMLRELQYGASYFGRIDRNEEAIAVSEKVARALKPEGALNVQLRIVKGKAVPFELNTRFSSSECVRAHYGFNAAEAILENYLFDNPISIKDYQCGMFARFFEECYFSESELKNISDFRYIGKAPL